MTFFKPLKNMLQKIILVIALLVGNSLYAQNNFYFKFSDEKCVNGIYDVIPYNNDEFLVAFNRKNCDDVASFVSGEIAHVSNKGTIIKTVKKFTNAPDVIENIVGLHQITGGFFIVTQRFESTVGNYSLGFYQCDKNFNTLNSAKILSEDEPNLIHSYYDAENEKIIYCYYDDSFNSFVGSFSTDCKNSKQSLNIGKKFSSVAYSVNKAIDKKDNYLIGTDWGYIVIDSSLGTITKLASTDDNNNANIKPYNKNSYLTLSEESFGFPENLNQPQQDNITCKKLDKDWKVLKNRTLGKLKNKQKVDTFDIVGQKTLDFKDPNKIYVGWQSVSEYEFLAPLQEQNVWIGISQLDSNLVPRWTRYFWGDGFNYLVGLVATPDNGVLAYGDQAALDPFYHNGFLLKINENGLVSSKDEVAENNIFVTVGPNPFRQNVTFAIGQGSEAVENMELLVYDILGQLVKKETLNYGLNHFSFSTLPSATYIYHVLSKNTLLKQGKLIKID
jgi:hypothetical protein